MALEAGGAYLPRHLLQLRANSVAIRRHRAPSYRRTRARPTITPTNLRIARELTWPQALETNIHNLE